MSKAQTQRATLIELKHVSKTFGRTRVLSDVTLDVAAGEIRGLVGKNGSGKSTLIKILSGYHAPDPGSRLILGGEEVSLPLRVGESDALGLSFMHQDLGLVASLSVLENVRVGRFETGRFGRIRWRNERQRVNAALASVGADARWNTIVEDLSALNRALVALARCLMLLEERPGGGVMILDEPTSFMPENEAQRLFAAMHHAADIGHGVIFVSHRLGEVLGICDSVSVLRDGELVATLDRADTDEAGLVKLILGRDLGSFYPEPRQRPAGDRPVLGVSHLRGRIIRDVSFQLRKGEVLGMTGVRGMGHEELPYLIFGSGPTSGGQIRINDRDVAATHMTPARSIAAGIILTPANRREAGLVPGLSVLTNVSLPMLSRYFSRLRLHGQAEHDAAQALVAEHGIVPPRLDIEAGLLSGGNQQKLVLAKWLQTEPQACLLHEPTAGVDVGAKRMIFDRIEAIAARGGGVLVSSDEWQDLAHICDRVGILSKGELVAVLAGPDCTEERIAERCYQST